MSLVYQVFCYGDLGPELGSRDCDDCHMESVDPNGGCFEIDTMTVLLTGPMTQEQVCDALVEYWKKGHPGPVPQGTKQEEVKIVEGK